LPIEVSKVLAHQEKEKKGKYLTSCLEMRKDFTPMVYSVDGVAGREASSAEKRLAILLAAKWKHQYSQVVYFGQGKDANCTGPFNQSPYPWLYKPSGAQLSSSP
jgi:hypothetical protein